MMPSITNIKPERLAKIVNTDKKKKAKIFIKKGVSIKEWKRIRWDSGPISA